jgi:Rrf2 family protein
MITDAIGNKKRASMQLSRKADYALRAVRYLSSLTKGQLGSISAIAEGESLQRDYLAKVLRKLTRSGLLTATQGAQGGHRLVREPHEISFLDVILAVNEPTRINLCTENDGAHCKPAGSCSMHKFWIAQEKSLKRALARQTFAQRHD